MAGCSLGYFHRLNFRVKRASAPVVPLCMHSVRGAFVMAGVLFSRNIFMGPIIPPTYSPGSALVHFSLVTARSGRRVSFTVNGLIGYFGTLSLLWSVVRVGGIEVCVCEC